jgi:hypothetical protein
MTVGAELGNELISGIIFISVCFYFFALNHFVFWKWTGVCILHLLYTLCTEGGKEQRTIFLVTSHDQQMKIPVTV